METIFLVLGFVILLLAGDALVRGAVNLSLRLGVPALIVSLTIVAFGTSAPELLIAIKAVASGAPGLALGNVVGSNTANVLLVLGIPAMIAGLHTSACDSKRTYMIMLTVSTLFIALCFGGPIVIWHGAVLLMALVFVMGDTFIMARWHRQNGKAALADEVEMLDEADPEMPYWQISIYILLGLVGLPVGANLLVDSAVVIAHHFMVSDTVIGLTIIALGTSLPELATTVMAALRRQADVALGNVIGSNMFNLLAIVGVASIFGPIPVAETFLRFDLWVMLAASLALIPFVMFCRDITRFWGVVLTGAYLVYIYFVISGGAVS